MMNDITQILMALIMTSTEHQLTNEHVTDALTNQDSMIVVGYEYVWDNMGNKADIILWKGDYQILSQNWLSDRVISEIRIHEDYNDIPFRFHMNYKDDICMCTKKKQYIVYKVERRF